jgi:hypothetical protein
MTRNRWVIVALTTLVTVYCLNRGVYIGSELMRDGSVAKGCQYLYISGIKVVYVSVGVTAQEANRKSPGCGIFGP